MKSLIVCLSILFCSMVFAEDWSHLRVHGHVATSSFGSTNGCISTGAIVDITEIERSFSTGSFETVLVAFVILQETNICTSEVLHQISDQHEINRDQFSIATSLSSAALRLDFDAFDYNSNTRIPISVNLQWNATSKPERSIIQEFVTAPQYTTKLVGTSSTAEAVATGTVTDGNTNFTPEPSWEALIISNFRGSLIAGDLPDE
jgi:hypothetical protein